MGNWPIQLNKAAYWAKRWAGELPSLYTKEKEQESVVLVISFISARTSAMFQWGCWVELIRGSIACQLPNKLCEII